MFGWVESKFREVLYEQMNEYLYKWSQSIIQDVEI